MKKAQLIHICGDIHGDWARLNRFINTDIRQSRHIRSLAGRYDELEVILLQCGDFGYWPHTDPEHSWFALEDTRDDGGRYAVQTAVSFLKNGRVVVYWADGNHENHDALDALESAHPDSPFIAVAPGVFFARFGAVLTLLDGIHVMFCGGAESVDKNSRMPGIEWWSQEGIDEADMRKLPDPRTVKVDWLISHSCPHAFDLNLRKMLPAKNREASKRYLDRVLEDFRPKRWWFGHYHHAQGGVAQGCRWCLLDYLGNYGGRPWVETLLIEKEE